jgi:hypothetical protein
VHHPTLEEIVHQRVFQKPINPRPEGQEFLPGETLQPGTKTADTGPSDELPNLLTVGQPNPATTTTPYQPAEQPPEYGGPVGLPKQFTEGLNPPNFDPCDDPWTFTRADCHQPTTPNQQAAPATPRSLSANADQPNSDSAVPGDNLASASGEPGPESPYYAGVDFRTEPDTAYFWTGYTEGIGGDNFARSYALSQGGTTLEMFLDENRITMPKWEDRTPEAVKAWTDASSAFAWGASGTVRVLFGQVRRPNNVFEKDELPVLLRNENVSRIIAIDPYTLVETEMFRRESQ